MLGGKSQSVSVTHIAHLNALEDTLGCLHRFGDVLLRVGQGSEACLKLQATM